MERTFDWLRKKFAKKMDGKAINEWKNPGYANFDCELSVVSKRLLSVYVGTLKRKNDYENGVATLATALDMAVPVENQPAMTVVHISGHLINMLGKRIQENYWYLRKVLAARQMELLDAFNELHGSYILACGDFRQVKFFKFQVLPLKFRESVQ